MIPRVYLDNVITCGWVLKDLQPTEEMAAVDRIYELHDRGLIKIVTSKMSRIEQERTTDVNKRAALAAQSDIVSVVQNDHRLLGFFNLDYGRLGFISNPIISDIVDDSLFQGLTAIAALKDADAKHVMYAAVNDCQYFVTLDTRDLLSKRSLIESLCPQMRVVMPTEALATLGV